MSNKLRYEPLSAITHDEFETIVKSGQVNDISKAILRSSLNDNDWRWVQEKCFKLLLHDNENVVASAALALAHLARIHGTIDLDLVMPALEKARLLPNIAGRIDDAIEDIEIFCKK